MVSRAAGLLLLLLTLAAGICVSPMSSARAEGGFGFGGTETPETGTETDLAAAERRAADALRELEAASAAAQAAKQNGDPNADALQRAADDAEDRYTEALHAVDVVRAYNAQVYRAQEALTQRDRCYTCDLFSKMEKIKALITTKITTGLAEPADDFLGKILLMYLMFAATLIAGGILPATSTLKQMVVAVLFFVLAIQLLKDYAAVDEYVFSYFLNQAVALGKFIIVEASSITDAGQGGANRRVAVDAANFTGYSSLMYLVEAQMKIIVAVVIDQFKSVSLLSSPMTVFLGVLLLLAFLFVILIFAAFMVESLFKFAVISICSPLLLICLPFKITRPFVGVGLRTLLGAALVIVFASVAMGLTMGVVDDYSSMLSRSVKEGQANKACATIAEQAAYVAGGGAVGSGGGSGGGAAIDYNCIQSIDFGDPSMIVFYVIGFVSILLHLQAKTLATNFSGANDGVGPAAATVAAAKAGLGVGTLGASRTLFGSGGLTSSMRGMQDGMGGALVQGGAIGAAGEGVRNIVNAMGGGTAPAAASVGTIAGDSSAPGSGRGLDGGGMSDTQMKTMGQILGKEVGKQIARFVR